VDFIGGLGGSDITFDHFELAMDRTIQASKEGPLEKVYWFGLE
jgi:hypothetical protein